MTRRSKKVISYTTLVLFCCTAKSLGAKGVETLFIGGNEICSISVPFEVKRFKLSNTKVACVELMSPNMLHVTGCHNGRCDLNVQGDTDMQSQRYEINVVGEITDAMLRLERLRDDLECVPEVRIGIVSDHVRVEGVVVILKKWIYLEKVLKKQTAFHLENSVQFIPHDPMVISGLKDKLVHDGFDVILKPSCDDGLARKVNSVNIWYDNKCRKLLVRALVDSEETWKRIFRRLRDEGVWLRFETINGIKICSCGDSDGRTPLDVQVRLLGVKVGDNKEQRKVEIQGNRKRTQ